MNYLEESAIGIIIALLSVGILAYYLSPVITYLLDKLFGSKDDWNRGDFC